jgi:hypothetical protein
MVQINARKVRGLVGLRYEVYAGMPVYVCTLARIGTFGMISQVSKQ